MPLTAAQNLAIKNDILASPDLNAVPATYDGAYALADLYNAVAVPDFFVWKTRLHEQEITSLKSSENTTWSWPTFIGRSVSEQNGWERMFNGTYTVNPSLLQVRVGMDDIFSGGTGAAQRTHINAISKEKATRIEKLLADVTNGNGAIATPATRVFFGKITPQEVYAARNS